ncbi:hypothetical protein MHJ94_07050 [Chryseobacterium taklimakanense]|uniref:DUF4350 domain-containing protein n=1 Tax=Chryseobacterium taklimakanense TaxID=536441 RepID=UPI001EF7116F|nr:DUF4350 domain-containing protein [Chryseobacterium taklimakanense]MCG7281054.1 hypothetical protein [Chryseobacterium taklimakanense]
MNKTFKIYAILFAIVLAVLALLEFSKNEVTDWRKNFEVDKKSPFGLYIFNQEAGNLFKNKLKKTEESPYYYYEEGKKYAPHNILVILREFDTYSWNRILQQVSEGSDAMVIAERFPRHLSDTLKFQTSMVSFDEQQKLKFTDKKFVNDSLNLDKLPSGNGFIYTQEENQILGKLIDKEKIPQPNFLKVKHGKGHIYLHSEPLFLTNYYLLKRGNEKYLENVFSYFPEREIVWFTENSSVTTSRSPLRVILANDALRYSWWLLLAGLLLFVVFNAKRKQRIVPVIEPLKNKSAEFVKSVGNLYLQEGDFHDMMAKKAQYFLNKVRMELMIETQILDETFAKKLHVKTGTSLEKINEAISLIKKAQDPYAPVMKEDLIRMNKILDEILK